MSLAHSPPPTARLALSNLLPSNRDRPAAMDTGDFTPAESRKRPRVGTPPNNGTRLIDKISSDMSATSASIGAAVLNIKHSSLKEMAGSLNTIFNDIIVKALEKQANTMSDLAGTITGLNVNIQELTEENEALKEELKAVKAVRESQQVKESSREMEGQLREAITKVKVMDLDFGACLNDRKQLIETGRATLREKVRSDLRAGFDTLMSRASLAVIARATAKRAYPEGDRWTAPVLITIPDRDTRWETEDILRQSKCYPSFHWPKEMIEPVKVLRKAMVDAGVDDTANYIRIRPDDRDGKLRIRADVKTKEGKDKFAMKATWPVPTYDVNIRPAGWSTPTWANVAANPATASSVIYTRRDIENM